MDSYYKHPIKDISVSEYMDLEFSEIDETLLNGVNTLKQLCEKIPEAPECREYDV